MGRIAALVSVVLLVSAPSWGADTPAKPAAPTAPVIKERVVMGWLESIFVKPWNRRLTAKLDTGAKTSSLHADKIEHFSKNGEPWVRFSLVDIEDRRQAPVRVEKALVRTAYIKSHQSESSKRDVVMMTICKNGRDYEAEFNLVDRSNFNYPVLLGRAFLKDVALVDANATFLFKGEDDPCVTGAPVKPR
ncbi:MAG: ATP-dependent zinc protease [Proteobacteria bacterium]|nr:ATP-dependent zinc protease [Pseudomonadota bacterium]